jgi:DNA-binding response OmpR family regulator
VLLAVSDATLRAALTRSLDTSGATLLQTDGGEEVLALLEAEPPSVLVLSASLHGVQGLDVCHRLRFGQRDAQPPIVMLADVHAGWRLAADLRDSLGVAHCFEAPFDTQRVAQTVRLLLASQSVPEEPPPLSPEAEAKWNAGMEAFERGDLATAIERLEAGVGLEPRAFELQYHLGLLYGRKDQLFLAIRALEIAVALQPRHFAAIKNLAVVYQRVGFRLKALDAWERAKAAAPDDETRTNIKQHMISLL